MRCSAGPALLSVVLIVSAAYRLCCQPSATRSLRPGSTPRYVRSNGEIQLTSPSGDRFRVPCGGEPPCPPLLDSRAKVIVVAADEHINCYSFRGSLSWSKELDYYYNPLRLVASSSALLYDQGPNHVPPPTSSLGDWLELSRRLQLITCVSL